MACSGPHQPAHGASQNHCSLRTKHVACIRGAAAAVLGEDRVEIIGCVHWRSLGRAAVCLGGSLATLLAAGEWRRAAFAVYLREHQVGDCAVSKLVVDHSDSELGSD